MTLLLDVPDRIYESPSEQVKRRISELTKLPLEILKKNGKIFLGNSEWERLTNCNYYSLHILTNSWAVSYVRIDEIALKTYSRSTS